MPLDAANLRGIILVTLAMAFLAIGDATIKALSASYSPATMMAVPAGCFVLLGAVFAVATGRPVLDPRAFRGAALARSLVEVVAALMVINALARVPLSILTMILQAMPLIVTLGAVLFLGERVGPRRWIAIAAGFAGVMVVLQPGGADFRLDWLLALAGAVALSVRDLVTRLVPPQIGSGYLAVWAAATVAVAGFVILFASGEGFPAIPMRDWPGFGVIVVCWAGGAISIAAGMRVGDVSVVAPFRYMRLPFGVLLATLVFGEVISPSTLLGVGIIVASGLYIFVRDKRDVQIDP